MPRAHSLFGVLFALLLCLPAQSRASDAEALQQALYRACAQGGPIEVREALAYGADVNAPRFGPGGLTPLMFAAAENEDPEVLKILLEAGADVHARTATGETALMFAARYGSSPAALEPLLAAGADPNAQNIAQNTALHLAAGWNDLHPAVAERLVLAGANGMLPNENRRTAFFMARLSNTLHKSAIFEQRDPARLAEQLQRLYAKRLQEQAERERLAAARAGKNPDTQVPPPDTHPQVQEEENCDVTGDWTGYPNDPYTSKLAEEPGMLSKDMASIEPLRENAGIDLERYSVDNPGNILPSLDAPSTLSLFARAEMPVLDGALASFPLYSAFAGACYEPPSGSNTVTPEGFFQNVVTYNNTIEAFSYLVERHIDIFFGLEPDESQKQYAEQERNRELVYTTLRREAFVFFVHKDNPVESLTVEQVKDIYAGRITNWKDVGGPDMPILPFQRNAGSGSQSTLLRFMGEPPLMPPPIELDYGMEGIFTKVASYRSVPGAIGFSFYFFSTRMVDAGDVKLLAVNNVVPSKEHIRDNSYPILVNRYAVTLKDNAKPALLRFLEWMQGPQGQELVEKLGYVGN